MHELSEARRVLAAIGPGHLLLVGKATDALAIELRRLGCRVTAAERLPRAARARPADMAPIDAVLWAWEHGVAWPELQALQQAWGITRLVLLRDAARAAPPADLLCREAAVAGWRRAVCAWSLQHYGDLDRPQSWTELFFDSLPVGTQTLRLPIGMIDPTLGTGPRHDALLARYAMAADLARPGDRVVVVGAGCGAGAALIAHRSRCASVLACESSAPAVDYARRHFGLSDVVRHQVASADRLDFVAARTVDLVVAVDVFDTFASPTALADEFARVLKPDGRVVASIADAVDSTRSGDALQDLLAQRFLIEARHHQPLPDDAGMPRSVDRVALGDPVPPGGWRLVVAAANPLAAAELRFEHPEFARGTAPPSAPVADFGTHYDNPWLYRPMVQMGQRLQDEQRLTELALDVLARARPASADLGAALCVLAYQVLGRRQVEQVANLLPLIDAYCEAPPAQPHVARWQISLEFAAALACLTTGDLDAAKTYFERVTRRDPLAFSPLLSTKTVASWFWLGVRQTVDRSPDAAQACFEAGCRAAARALQAPIEASVGTLERPNTFGFQELAEVADMASQCAQALDALPYFAASPGRFWRQIDTRRFGLATWLLHLERENRELRERLQALAR